MKKLSILKYHVAFYLLLIGLMVVAKNNIGKSNIALADIEIKADAACKPEYVVKELSVPSDKTSLVDIVNNYTYSSTNLVNKIAINANNKTFELNDTSIGYLMDELSNVTGDDKVDRTDTRLVYYNVNRDDMRGKYKFNDRYYVENNHYALMLDADDIVGTTVILSRGKQYNGEEPEVLNISLNDNISTILEKLGEPSEIKEIANSHYANLLWYNYDILNYKINEISIGINENKYGEYSIQNIILKGIQF